MRQFDLWFHGWKRGGMLISWLSGRIEPKPQQRPRRKGHSFSLRAERLEDRVTPSAMLLRDLATKSVSAGLAASVAVQSNLIHDVNAKTYGSDPAQFVTIGKTTFFTADDGTHGRALWKTDGTAAGTVLVKDINPNADVGPMYWAATTSIWPGPYASASIDNLTGFRGTLYFTGDDGTHGVQLWKSDGTAAGTVMLTKFEANGSGTASFPYFGRNVDNLTVAGDRLYFTVSPSFDTAELWVMNGAAPALLAKFHADNVVPPPVIMAAAANTMPAAMPYYGPMIGNLTNVGGMLYFAGYDSDHGNELWKSDGTATGTKLVADINSGAANSDPGLLTALNGKLYLRANDGTHGGELWTSDGTAAGTRLIADTNPGPVGGLDWNYAPGSTQPELMKAGGKLFFNADDGTHGQELWTSDGTTAGTQLLKDIHPNDGPPAYPGGPPALGSVTQNLTEINGTVYFSADDGARGQELWRSDGTPAGTMLLKDIWAGKTPSYFGGPDIPASSSPGNFFSVGGSFYFTAADAEHGAELWRSDGTAAGTKLVQDINPGRDSAFFPWTTNTFAINGNKFLFTADDGTHGRELFVLPLADPPAPPLTIDAGGPYKITEGGDLRLQAQVTGSPDAGKLRFSWDLDGDGQFDDARGAHPTLHAAQLRALGLSGGPGAHSVRVHVEDRTGHDLGTAVASLKIDDAPLLVSGVTAEVAEGQRFNRIVANFKDPGGPESLAHYSATIVWGDGSTSIGTILRDGVQLRVSGAHQYAQAGKYAVQVRIADESSAPQIATSQFTVHDAGLFATRHFLRATAGRSFTATVASFRDRNSLGQLADYSAAITWGDGTSSTATIVANPAGGYDVVGTHTYAKSGNYAIQVKISDRGTITTVHSNLKADDIRIVARGLTGIAVATQDSIVAVAAFSDSDRSATADRFKATIDWADGSVSAGVIDRDGFGGFRVRGTHRYTTTGLRSVRVLIQDAAGASATTTGTVRVMGAA